VINSLGGEQNNVVFMGRRSFRMEIAGGSGSNELAIPMSASSVPTARIFASDRERAGWESAAAALRPTSGRSNASLVALCLTTFGLGIALTLTFNGRAAPRRAPEAAAVEPAQVAAPAAPAPAEPTMVIQPMPVAAPTDAELLAGFPLPPARRPLAKPARAARPRPLRAARSADSADAEASTSADPFADPAPTTKATVTATAKATVKPTAKPWVDPFAE
jgi:hypothetical protein